MSKISTIFGGGGDAADAAREAGDIQARATREAAKEQGIVTREQIAFQKESLATARADLAPFKEAGAETIAGLKDLITDPTVQLDFIRNNPFFTALAEESKTNILKSSAARGKSQSGGTEEALQNSLVLLGSDLLNQNITQRQNLVTLGANAAAGQATATQRGAATISDLAQTGVGARADLTTSGAAASAAGVVGAANARTDAANAFLKLGGDVATAAIAACDIRVKENIERVGQLPNGLPVYLFNYIGSDIPQINVMAQDVEKVNPDAVIEINGIKHIIMEAAYGN